MKKVIFFVLLIVLTGNLYAQSDVVLRYKKVVSGREYNMYVAPKDSGGKYAPLPVELVGSTSGIAAAIALLQVYQTPANKSYMMDSLLVSTEIDSISAPTGTLVWHNIDVIAVKDTIEWSYTKSFAERRRIFPGMSVYLGKLSVTAFPKIYIRRKGVAGTSVYDISITSY